MSAYPTRQVTLKDGTSITLRSAKPQEAQALLDYLDVIRRESWGLGYGPDDELPSLEEERAWIESHSDTDDCLHLTAWSEGGELIGMANVSAGGHRLRVRGRAELGLSVRRTWWRRGVGRALMVELLAFARSNPHIHVLRLGVYAHNHKAVALYQAMGFEHEGTRRWSVRFEDGTFGDEYLMSLWVGDGDPPKARTFDPVLEPQREAERLKAVMP